MPGEARVMYALVIRVGMGKSDRLHETTCLDSAVTLTDVDKSATFVAMKRIGEGLVPFLLECPILCFSQRLDVANKLRDRGTLFGHTGDAWCCGVVG